MSNVFALAQKIPEPVNMTKDGDEDTPEVVGLETLVIQSVDNGYINTFAYEDETEVTEVYQDALEMFNMLLAQYGLEDYKIIKKKKDE